VVTAQPTDPERIEVNRAPFLDSFGARPQQDSRSAVTLDQERKTVTAQFADIKGLTELEQDLEPVRSSIRL
jgi:class 3 adenylate cyclase